jgi:hypothetical protein
MRMIVGTLPKAMARRLRADLGFEPEEKRTLRHLAAHVMVAQYETLTGTYTAMLTQDMAADGPGSPEMRRGLYPSLRGARSSGRERGTPGGTGHKNSPEPSTGGSGLYLMPRRAAHERRQHGGLAVDHDALRFRGFRFGQA